MKEKRIRTIILPPAIVEMLRTHKDTVNARWLFLSPKKEDAPLDPASVRKKLCKILARAGCRKIRFHDLRHISAATTLNIYPHITDNMRETAVTEFVAYTGKRRKPGAGCISQIGEQLWEGKYSPERAGWQEAVQECLCPQQGGV